MIEKENSNTSRKDEADFEDPMLKEFLTGPGKAILDIKDIDWILYRRASTSTIEVQEFVNKTNKEKGRQIRKNKNQIKKEEAELNKIVKIVEEMEMEKERMEYEIKEDEIERKESNRIIKEATEWVKEKEKIIKSPMRDIDNAKNKIERLMNEINEMEKKKTELKINGKQEDEERLYELIKEAEHVKQNYQVDKEDIEKKIENELNSIKLANTDIIKHQKILEKPKKENRLQIKDIQNKLERQREAEKFSREQIEYLTKENKKLENELTYNKNSKLKE